MTKTVSAPDGVRFSRRRLNIAVGVVGWWGKVIFPCAVCTYIFLQMSTGVIELAALYSEDLYG